MKYYFVIEQMKDCLYILNSCFFIMNDWLYYSLRMEFRIIYTRSKYNFEMVFTCILFYFLPID